MAGAFVLHADNVAHYHWGSQMISVLGSATIKGRMVVEILADAHAGTYRWTRPRDVRASLAITHELVHLQQDISTGIGAWDYLATRDTMPALVEAARWMVMKYTPSPYRPTIDTTLATLDGAFAEGFRTYLNQVSRGTVGFRHLRPGSGMSPEERSELARWEGINPGDPSLKEYTLRKILEGEAACLTETVLTDGRMADSSREELDRYRGLWSVPKMSDEYSAAFLDTWRAFTNGEDVDADIAPRLYDHVRLIAAWMMDVAQSYPPADMLNVLGHPEMFDPVVRHFVLLRSLNRMSLPKAQSMVEALIAGEMTEAERLLLEFSSYPYPTSSEIYSSWLDTLTASAPDPAAWDYDLLLMRINSIQHRLENGSAKGIVALVDSQTSLQVMVEGLGIQGIIVGEHLLEDRRTRYYSALAARMEDLELFDLLFEYGAFVCPLAVAHACEGRIPRCSSGHTRLDQLPSEDSCSVRRRLHEAGYYI
jgi:hypothetical protein